MSSMLLIEATLTFLTLRHFVRCVNYEDRLQVVGPLAEQKRMPITNRSNLTFKLLAGNLEGKIKFGVPYGSRTRVAAVKGRCPRPLDERDA